MDKLINDRKKELLDMQQLLKMQDLLEQYDRQNFFLNKQVDTLLKENILLKQQKSLLPSASSHLLATDNYLATESYRTLERKGSLAFNEQGKCYSYQKRKSRYEYMYDEGEIRGLKTGLKNQIKWDAMKQQASKQIQTNIEELSIQIPSKIHDSKHQLKRESKYAGQRQQKQAKYEVEKQPRFQMSKPQQGCKSQLFQQSRQQKFTPVRKQGEHFMAGSQQMSRSKSKSKSKSRQKLQVSLKSSPHNDYKPVFSTEAKTQSPKHDKSRQKQQFSLKQIQEGAELILEHSFGNKSAQKLQKKFTIMEAELNLGESKQEKTIGENNESRFSNQFLPLSIESKQLAKNIGRELPRDLSRELPKDFSRELPKDLSRELPKDFSRELPKDFSRELPRDTSKYLSKDISINASRSELQKPGLSLYSQQGIRSSSTLKRNHSLNPSPKVQINPSQLSNQTSTLKIKPFIIHTQSIIPSSSAPSVQLQRNPSDKIKRKFIKIVSSHTIPTQSPNK